MEARQILETYAEEYFERMEPLCYNDLRHRQNGQFASLAFGAAGIAYAYWHTAVVRGEERFLEGAERWSRWAWESRDDYDAFFSRRSESGPDPRRARELAAGAYLYGRVGVDLVRVLVAHTTGKVAEAESALEDLLGGCRSPVETSELFTGSAGTLRAATILLEVTGEERLLMLGRELAADLARREGLREGRERVILWRRESGPGLAHGLSGVLYALLSWFRVAGEPVPPVVTVTLDRLLQGALKKPERYCSRPTFVASLCNGFAGLTLLALEAHATLGGDRYLELARSAAHLSLGTLPSRLDLCCGRAAVASVCLWLAGFDPDGPWRRHALEITLSAMLVEPEEWEVTGLYGGEAVLPCLVADLLAEAPGGPPALEVPAAAKPGSVEAAVTEPATARVPCFTPWRAS